MESWQSGLSHLFAKQVNRNVTRVRIPCFPQAFRMAARYLFRLTRRKDAEKLHGCHYEVAEVVCFAPGNRPGAFVDI